MTSGKYIRFFVFSYFVWKCRSIIFSMSIVSFTIMSPEASRNNKLAGGERVQRVRVGQTQS